MKPKEWLKRGRIVAIVRGLPEKHILPLSEAIFAGGIDMIEVTFNQSLPETWRETQRAIYNIASRFSGPIMVGAGTVMTLEQLHMAQEAGAKFFVSPNVNAEIIHAAKALDMGAFPGTMTSSEAAAAHRAGADAVKLFPAGNLGVGYLKALSAPLSNIDFIAVGGINEQNAGDFLHAGAIGVGIGGNLVNREWIEAGAFSKITELALKYRKAVDQA